MIGENELLAAMLDAESTGEEYFTEDSNPYEIAAAGEHAIARSGIDSEAALRFARGRARAWLNSYAEGQFDTEIALTAMVMQGLIVGVRVGGLVDADA